MTIYTFNLLVGYEPNGSMLHKPLGQRYSGLGSDSEVCLYRMAHSRKISLLPLFGAPGVRQLLLLI